MELETLFTASKWEILRELADRPFSPLQLAERSSTSLANISQQLRLLEMAGLVKSKRLPNRDKGQPRVLYRLAEDQGFVIAAANDFVEKKLLKLSLRNKITLRIWLFEDPEIRYTLEKAFWQTEPFLLKMESLGVQVLSEEKVQFCVVSKILKTAELPEFRIVTPAGRQVAVSFLVSDTCPGESTLLYRAAD